MQLQAENAQLADRLDESDDGSPPSVPLAVYQELQETEAQKIKELERQLTAMQQQHQTQVNFVDHCGVGSHRLLAHLPFSFVLVLSNVIRALVL